MVKKTRHPVGGEHMNRDELQALETKLREASQKMIRIRSGSLRSGANQEKSIANSLSPRGKMAVLMSKLPPSSNMQKIVTSKKETISISDADSTVSSDASESPTRGVVSRPLLPPGVEAGQSLSLQPSSNTHKNKMTNEESESDGETESTISSAKSNLETTNAISTSMSVQTDDGHSNILRGSRSIASPKSETSSLDKSRGNEPDDKSMEESVLSTATSDLLAALSSISDHFLTSKNVAQSIAVKESDKYRRNCDGETDTTELEERHQNSQSVEQEEEESFKLVAMSLSMIDAALSLESTPSGLQAAVDRMIRSPNRN